MSIYHLSVKVIGRSAGRSATGAAAYRCAEKIRDERSGLIFDFTRKQGVEHAELIMPGAQGTKRAEFWNQVELHHKRGDSVLSREVEIALPSELTAEQRKLLALEFARELSQRYSVAADVAIHALSREGDERNHHAHIMLSACRVEAGETLGKKAAELGPIYCQKHRLPNMADRERERWADLSNQALERAGRLERSGRSSHVAMRIAMEVSDRLEQAQAAGQLQRDLSKVNKSILDTSGDLEAAIKARDAMLHVRDEALAGVAAFRAQADQRRAMATKKQEVLQAFHAFQAERVLAQAKELAERERNARELARQREQTLERVAQRTRGRDGQEL